MSLGGVHALEDLEEGALALEALEDGAAAPEILDEFFLVFRGLHLELGLEHGLGLGVGLGLETLPGRRWSARSGDLEGGDQLALGRLEDGAQLALLGAAVRGGLGDAAVEHCNLVLSNDPRARGAGDLGVICVGGSRQEDLGSVKGPGRRQADAAEGGHGRRKGQLQNNCRYDWNFSNCTQPPVFWARARLCC